jgi:hypothetical protein
MALKTLQKNRKKLFHFLKKNHLIISPFFLKWKILSILCLFLKGQFYAPKATIIVP